MNIDEKTYGDSQAAINLADMLNKTHDDKLVSAWSNHYHRYTKSIRNLYALKNDRFFFGDMLTKHTVNAIESNPTLTKYPLIKSHCITVIKSHFKRFLEDTTEAFLKRK